MASKKTIDAFVVSEDDFDDEGTVVAPGGTGTKKGRVKGTWTMYWGTEKYEFEDGKVYVLPTDLYTYLRQNDSIYDTL
jgi:hypothetical protein